MKLRLRDYQIDCVEKMWNYWEKGGTGNPVGALPTGTGKSLVLAEFVERALKAFPSTRIQVITHRKELIQQNYAELKGQWEGAPAGIYSAGLGKRQVGFPITFGGIASVYQMAEVFGHVDMVWVDECHMVSQRNDTMYGKYFDALRRINPAFKVAGLSATPYRVGQGMVTDGGIFSEVVCDYTDRESYNALEGCGYLAPLVTKKTEGEFDLSDVGVPGGEFIQKALHEAVDRDSITRAAIGELVDRGLDRKCWLIFTAGIAHAMHTTEELRKLGIRVGVVHSKQKPAENARQLLLFKRGEITALVNSDILTTGFNHKRIDLIGMLRPVMSPGLWVQMLGRGTRTHPDKKDCLVLDFAGNARRSGPINDPVIPNPPGKKGGGVAPVRCCEACGSYNHASVKVCKDCGEPFPEAPSKLSTTAGSEEVVARDGLVVKEHVVTGVEFLKHQPRDPEKPVCMLVKYRCGLRVFKEYVGFEHTGFMLHKAHEWWGEHAGNEDYPETTEEAILLASELEHPKRLRVWEKTPMPEILATFY